MSEKYLVKALFSEDYRQHAGIKGKYDLFLFDNQDEADKIADYLSGCQKPVSDNNTERTISVFAGVDVVCVNAPDNGSANLASLAGLSADEVEYGIGSK